MRLYWFCERSEYKNECTEYTSEKGYQGGHCIPGAEGLCRPFQSYTAEKYSVLEKVDKGIEMKKCFFAEEIEKILERGAF